MGIDRLLSSDRGIARREFLKIGAAVGGVVLLNRVPGIHAQDKKRISVATGGMGGVYFVLGGGVASVLTKYAGVEATAEVTAASVDNCKLVGAKKADLAFSMNDVAYDAFKGQGNFKSALPLRTLCVTYPNIMHVVTTESSGIKKVADLKGKRVSTGAPGSGTEVKALRTLEAAGLNHEKDVKKDRLGAAESAGAMKDGKIDAYFWDGGVPTSSVMDLAASPGIKMVLIPHEDLIAPMTAKYGPVYYKSIIPKGVYTGVDYDTPVCGVANVILCHEAMEDALAYQITRVIFEHQPELQAIHKEATNLTLENGSSNKAVPYHPGAAKYFKEKGLSVAA
jgi:TRAP transporter TAXI family solute receptor